MPGTIRIDLALRVLAAIFLAVAAVALLLPPAVPAVEVPLDLEPVLAAATPSTTFDASDATAGQLIIEANIFSPDRSAPAERYNPFVFEPPPAPAMSYEADAMDATATADENAVPHLYGVIAGPAGVSALMRLDPELPDARLYREGDRAGAWRVVQINEQSVVLDGPRGRIELRLIRREGPRP